jgi:hypothetical protein
MCEVDIRSLATRVTDLSPLAFDVGVLFNPIGNFSLAMLPNGNWLCSMRRFGYWISSITQAYLTNPEMKLERPDEQLFLELDGDFNLVRQFTLVKNEYYKDQVFSRETPFLEDGRIVQWGGMYYLASAIFYQDNGHYEKFGLEVQRLDFDGDNIAARHVWSSVEHGITGRHKNWMPIPDRPFRFVSATFEHGSQMVDISANRLTEVGTCGTELFRGNTNLHETDYGYITVTHKLAQDDLGRKRYVNYFVQYNQDLSVRHISKPFKLCGSNIEFVTWIHISGSRMLAGVTEFDELPMVMEFDCKRVFGELFK